MRLNFLNYPISIITPTIGLIFLKAFSSFHALPFLFMHRKCSTTAELKAKPFLKLGSPKCKLIKCVTVSSRSAIAWAVETSTAICRSRYGSLYLQHEKKYRTIQCPFYNWSFLLEKLLKTRPTRKPNHICINKISIKQLNSSWKERFNVYHLNYTLENIPKQ